MLSSNTEDTSASKEDTCEAKSPCFAFNDEIS